MVKSTVLDNGVRVLSAKMPGVRSVSLGVWVGVGSRHDPPDNAGVAHFTEHMLFKGTKKRSALQIAKEIDALGGVLNAQTAKEYTVYYTRVLDEHLDKAADILFDLFLNSQIDEEELDKEKKVVLQEIRMTEDTPDDHVTDLFAEAFFPSSPLGVPILGTEEVVGSFRRENVLAFLSSRYTPSSIIIAAVGSLDHDRIVDLVRSRFSRLPRVQDPEPEKIFPERNSGSRVFTKDIEQVHITLGTTGPSMLDERRWAYITLNTMLGGSMSSMLFQEAREKLGLVYSIYSYVSSYRDCGVMAVYAATTPDCLSKTIEVIVQQMSRARAGDFGGASLEDVKEQVKGNLLLARESTAHRMSSLARNMMYYQRDVTDEEIIEKIRKVRVEDIVNLAEAIFQQEKITAVYLGKIGREDVREVGLP
ncbi:MAG: pitrilysin family protein [Desulfomonilia bacterium]|jgi:predicted Zn-dependent peptidase|nr:insulinase family protein [Deltaproteobacteria bacterium]MDX9760542.1 pitrilysin family protein [Desulfomonilia bacterium]HPW69227.1 pitrilysin family protein [Deltaproteobacteria bacterium]